MIQIYPDETQLSVAAADYFVAQSQKAITHHGAFSVVLSGGHTPQKTYERLAQEQYRNQVEWEFVSVFWGDERCVPADDPRSNERMAREALLNHVPIPKDQIYPIRDQGNPEAAAQAYEKDLHQFFRERRPQFDLIFLGLGENGHTASLFPNSPVLAPTQNWVKSVYVAEQDMSRITMTAPLLNQGQQIVFLVAGENKAHVLPKVLYGPRDEQELPAQLIQPTQGEVIWFVEKSAATYLWEEAASPE